jgi:hypothetical protein
MTMFDFDYEPPFDSMYPLTSDKLVWLADARSKIMAKQIAQGEFTPNTLYSIKEYLLRITGLEPEEYAGLTAIGMWIGWDRESRDLTEEQRAEYWAKYDEPVELTDEQAEELEEAGADFREFLAERMNERAAFDEIINNINKD